VQGRSSGSQQFFYICLYPDLSLTTAASLALQLSLLLSCHNIPISQLLERCSSFRRKILKSVSSGYILYENKRPYTSCIWSSHFLLFLMQVVCSCIFRGIEGTALQPCVYVAFSRASAEPVSVVLRGQWIVPFVHGLDGTARLCPK